LNRAVLEVMTSTRWTRYAAIAAVFAVGSTAALLLPATAAGHTLTKTRATAAIRAIAYRLSTELDGVMDRQAGACERRSIHRFRCTYFLKFDDGTICGQRMFIYYRTHSSRRTSAKPASEFDCGF
jgi:hypothetical protein